MRPLRCADHATLMFAVLGSPLFCGVLRAGETTEQFEETLKLVDEYRFPVLFTNQV